MPRPSAGVPAGAGTSTDRSFSAGLGKRAARGDQRAFAAIFEKYHQELYRYCLAIVRDREDAEDALQATMAASLRSLPGEERDIPLRPWLYRVAHNESVSLLRARTQEADAEDADPVTAMTGSVAAEVEGRDRLRQLVSDLRDLPERQRSAIVMRELNDLSYAEIAATLSCSEGAARQTVYEARTTLFTFEEGRAMECDPIREAISSRDGRRLRGRKVRAHLRVCEGCRNFEAVMTQRRADLDALVPVLPAMAASGMLAGLVGGSGSATVAAAGVSAGAGVAGVGGAGGGLFGSGVAGGMALKGASLIAAAVAAAGAADLGGVIDLPNPFTGKEAAREGGTSEKGAGGATSSGNEEAGSATGGGSAGGAAGGAAGGRDAGGQGQGPGGRGSSADAPGKGGGKGAAGGGRGKGGGHGNSGAAPGQTGSAPGQSGSTPGQSGTAPGKSGTTPGQSGTSSGKSGSAPSQSGSSSVSSGSAPGQTGTSPGQSGSTPGKSGSTPDASGAKGAASGQSGAASGHSASAPDKVKPPVTNP